MDAVKQVLAFIGAVIVGGGGLGFIVLQIFKRLGEKWLDARFDERLQNLRHEQAQQIEQLRFKVSTLLDRATKLHQREFEVLPEAWSKLCESFWAASALVVSLRQRTELNTMSDPQREDFITKSRLQDWQKDEVRQAHDKTTKYDDLIFWHTLGDARNLSVKSSRYLGIQGIFVEPELRKKMDRLNVLIWNSLIEAESNKQFDMREHDQAGVLRGEAVQLRDELETAIHQRIWPAAKAEL